MQVHFIISIANSMTLDRHLKHVIVRRLADLLLTTGKLRTRRQTRSAPDRKVNFACYFLTPHSCNNVEVPVNVLICPLLVVTMRIKLTGIEPKIQETYRLLRPTVDICGFSLF